MPWCCQFMALLICICWPRSNIFDSGMNVCCIMVSITAIFLTLNFEQDTYLGIWLKVTNVVQSYYTNEITHSVILNIPPEGKQYWYSKFWSVLTNSMYAISLNFPIIIISSTFHLLNGLHAYTLITLVTMMQNVVSNLSFHLT